jgi:tRNA(fMet)-specific endonuclease VapC
LRNREWVEGLMVCLDTSFLVDLLRRDEKALLELEKLESAGERISTTPISVSELFQGAYASRNSEEQIEKLREVMKRVELLDFSMESCERYGKLANELRSLGRKIGDLDTLIASLALSQNESVLTANVRHFNKIPDLIVRTW